MLSLLFAALGAIPGLGAIITYVTGKVYDSKVAITTAQIGGDRDVAVAMVQAESKNRTAFYDALGHSKTLSFLIIAFALPYVIWEWKIIVFDVVLQNYFGFGDTEPLHGAVADWATIIIPALFGSGTIAAVGNMYFTRKR